MTWQRGRGSEDLRHAGAQPADMPQKAGLTRLARSNEKVVQNQVHAK